MTPELPEALQVALRVIEVLEELGAPYHVGGSYASSIHGVPRQTQDIDVVVDLPPVSARSLVSMIKDDFYVDEESVMRAIRDKSSFNVIHLDSGIKVDLFVRGDAPFDLEEFARHRAELVQTEPERHIYVKTAEDILLRKLLWYQMGGEVSDRQWLDLLGIARTQGDDIDRSYVKHWARELGVRQLLDTLLAEL
jgi:hypothetical protein